MCMYGHILWDILGYMLVIRNPSGRGISAIQNFNYDLLQSQGTFGECCMIKWERRVNGAIGQVMGIMLARIGGET